MIIDPLQRFRPDIVFSVAKIAVCDVSGATTIAFHGDFSGRTAAKLAVTQQRDSGSIRGREYEVLPGRIRADKYTHKPEKRQAATDQDYPENTDSLALPIIRHSWCPNQYYCDAKKKRQCCPNGILTKVVHEEQKSHPNPSAQRMKIRIPALIPYGRMVADPEVGVSWITLGPVGR
jgi:hypothetical protein